MERYAYSRCMTCGCCLEACPQYDDDNYIGPQAIAQVRFFNMHPSGAHGSRRASGGPDGRRRHHQLWQRAELRAGLSDEHPVDKSDLRREPRDGAVWTPRLVEEIGPSRAVFLRSISFSKIYCQFRRLVQYKPSIPKGALSRGFIWALVWLPSWKSQGGLKLEVPIASLFSGFFNLKHRTFGEESNG